MLQRNVTRTVNLMICQMIYLPVVRAWMAILLMATLNLVLSLNQWQYKTLRELKEIKIRPFLVFVSSSPNI
jgi:hypothetical protein